MSKRSVDPGAPGPRKPKPPALIGGPYIPREELRAEIRRLEGHVLDMGEINARLYDEITKAIAILTTPMEPDEETVKAAVRVLRKAIRQSHARKA